MGDDAKLMVAGLAALHIEETDAHPFRDLFAEISGEVNVLALCGDLTNLGKPAEAEILGERSPVTQDPRRRRARQPRPRMRATAGDRPDPAAGGRAPARNAHPRDRRRRLRGRQRLRRRLRQPHAVAVRRGGDQAFHRRGRQRSHAAGKRAARADNRADRRGPALRPDRCDGRGGPEGDLSVPRLLAETIDRFKVSAILHGHAHYGAYAGKTAKGIPVYNCTRFVPKQSGKVDALIKI